MIHGGDEKFNSAAKRTAIEARLLKEFLPTDKAGRDKACRARRHSRICAGGHAPVSSSSGPTARISTSKKAVKKKKERALSANLEAAERKIASRKRAENREPDSKRVQFLPARKSARLPSSLSHCAAMSAQQASAGGLVTESHHADDYDRTPFLPNLFNCDICEVQFQAGLSGFEHFWSCQQW